MFIVYNLIYVHNIHENERVEDHYHMHNVVASENETD